MRSLFFLWLPKLSISAKRASAKILMSLKLLFEADTKFDLALETCFGLSSWECMLCRRANPPNKTYTESMPSDFFEEHLGPSSSVMSLLDFFWGPCLEKDITFISINFICLACSSLEEKPLCSVCNSLTKIRSMFHTYRKQSWSTVSNLHHKIGKKLDDKLNSFNWTLLKMTELVCTVRL